MKPGVAKQPPPPPPPPSPKGKLFDDWAMI